MRGSGCPRYSATQATVVNHTHWHPCRRSSQERQRQGPRRPQEQERQAGLLKKSLAALEQLWPLLSPPPLNHLLNLLPSASTPSPTPNNRWCTSQNTSPRRARCGRTFAATRTTTTSRCTRASGSAGAARSYLRSAICTSAARRLYMATYAATPSTSSTTASSRSALVRLG